MGWKRGKQLYGDRYIIEQELGKGGTGITYLAKTKKGKLVVIKTLKDEILNDPYFTEFANKYQNEFRDEALRLALCRHPHIVQIENVFNEGNLPCIAMEYLGGENLSDRVKEQGPLPETEALTYIWQIGEAVMAIHEKGLLHRDVKPRNIILRPSQNGETEAVLIDFGIAREFIPELAMTHTAAGSNGFAPIEQYAEKAPRGEYTDIYSLAGTLYYLLTVQVPIPAPTRAAKIALNPPEEFNPTISDRVRAAIIKGMEFDPEKRPQSIQEWLELLGDRPLSIRGEEARADKGLDYSKLKNLLVARKWQEADEETLSLMLQVSDRSQDGWLRAEDVLTIPDEVIRRIDGLWTQQSNGHFGFSEQLPIWLEVGGKPDAEYEIWEGFGDRVGWRVDGRWLHKDEIRYTMSAPAGHLPQQWIGSVGRATRVRALFSRVEILNRESGVDYTKLKDLLAAGQWKDADAETRAIMLKILCREMAAWESKEEIDNFPCHHLNTIDQLWIKYSHGRFGFSVQKQIWREMGGTDNADSLIYNQFLERMGWVVDGSWLIWHELTFNFNAPRGHLPMGLARGKVDFGIAFLARLESCQGRETDSKILTIKSSALEETDYRRLEDFLVAGKWKEADEATVTIILKSAGKNKDSRLAHQEVEKLPCSELKAINELWVKYSEGKFGFSVQQSIYADVAKRVEAEMGDGKRYYKMIWQEFSDAVGWRVNRKSLYYNELNFSLAAPRGHLPMLWCVKFKIKVVETVGVGVWRETFFNRVDSCC